MQTPKRDSWKMGVPSSSSDHVQGGFNGHGRPRIKALVRFPRFDVISNISFLLDTGADATLISHHDAVAMGIKTKLLRRPTLVTGVGGELKLFPEQAQATFEAANGKLYIYNQKLNIAAPNGPNQSLLGRDIIDRWKILYDPMKSSLLIMELDADKTVDGRSS